MFEGTPQNPNGQERARQELESMDDDKLKDIIENGQDTSEAITLADDINEEDIKNIAQEILKSRE